MEDSDCDIYSDLPHSNFDDGIEKLRANNKGLIKEICHLQAELAKLTKEKDEYQTKCATLAKNISSLLKTAQAEIQRKDKLIKDLRIQISDVAVEREINRKRRLQTEIGPCERKRSNNSCSARCENHAVKDSLSVSDKTVKENEIVNDSKNVSVCNNVSLTSLKQDRLSDENKFVSKVEPNLLLQNKKVIPSNGRCQTLYSQRMFNKMNGFPAANDSPENILPVENNERNDNLINRNNINRNGFHKSVNLKQDVSENVDQKLENTLTKVQDAISSAIPLSISGISKLTNSDHRCQPCKDKNMPTPLSDSVKNNEIDMLTKNGIKNETSKFLMPITSMVIKKSKQNVIMPVSSCWNGLVKPVSDNVRKEGEERLSANSEAHVNCKSSQNDGKRNDHFTQPEKSEVVYSRQNNILEHLFGSPLKWTENSNGSVPPLEFSSPTVYEDSCSAYIENAKFNLGTIKAPLQKLLKEPEPSEKSTSDNTPVKDIAKQETDQTIPEKERLISNEKKSVRAFEEVCSGNKQKAKLVFSSLKNDLSKFSTLALNLNKETSVDLPTNFQFKSKYEDSVLGQFDDTTQFVSALTKVESKISPLNTPVKSTPQGKSLVSSATITNTLQQQFSPADDKTEVTNITKLTSLPNNKSINEKPINILYPRKTPRIVSYNKINTKKSDTKPAVVVTDNTPTKSNRFAINDAFISQQEEKVLKNINNKDTIAITISAKIKNKGKEPTLCSPKGKQINLHLSPKRKLCNSHLSSKGKETNLVSPKGKVNFNGSCERIDNVFRNSKDKSAIFQNLEEHQSNLIQSPEDQSSNVNQRPIDKHCQSPGEKTPNFSDRKNINKLLSTKETDSKLWEHPEEIQSIILNPNEQEPKIDLNGKGKKLRILPSSLEKGNLRVQNFKPSSQLKKHNRQSSSQKQCDRDTETSKSPKEVLTDIDSIELRKKMCENKLSEKCDSLYKNVTSKTSIIKNEKTTNRSQQESDCSINQERLPMIVRSSKKPEFVSTTLLDDDCATVSPTKCSEQFIAKNTKGTELREWILKPITFEPDHRLLKKQNCIDKQLLRSKFDSVNKSVAQPNIEVEMHKNKSAPKIHPQINVKNSSSPSRVIFGRRPLNFGVSVTLN